RTRLSKPSRSLRRGTCDADRLRPVMIALHTLHRSGSGKQIFGADEQVWRRAKRLRKREILQAGLIYMRVSMANNFQKSRSRERSSLTAGLVVLAMALAVVGSLLYAQPMIRTYWWIASAIFR